MNYLIAIPTNHRSAAGRRNVVIWPKSHWILCQLELITYLFSTLSEILYSHSASPPPDNISHQLHSHQVMPSNPRVQSRFGIEQRKWQRLRQLFLLQMSRL